MKLIYTIPAVFLFATAPASAQNPPLISEPVPYDKDAVVEGDVAAGEAAYNTKGCVACHGARGVSVVPIYQTLAGKEASYVKAQLLGFQSGERVEPTMTAMSKLLNSQEVSDVALYLEAQTPPAAAE